MDLLTIIVTLFLLLIYYYYHYYHIIILLLVILLVILFPIICTYYALFYLKREHSIEASISKFGLISLRGVNLRLPHLDGTKIELEHLWLSSSYFDVTCTSRIALCFTTLKITTKDLGLIESVRNNQNEPRPPARNRTRRVTRDRPVATQRKGLLSQLLRLIEVKGGSIIIEQTAAVTSHNRVPQNIKMSISGLRFNQTHGDARTFNLTTGEITIEMASFVYRIESLSVHSSPFSKGLMIDLNRVIISDLSVPEVRVYSELPEELTKQRILFIENLQTSYDLTNRNLDFNINGDCFLQWNIAFHISLVDLISNISRSIRTVKRKLHKIPSTVPNSQPATASTSSTLSMKLELKGRMSFGALLSQDEQTICIDTHSLTIEAEFPGLKTIKSDLICLHFDENTMLTCNLLSVSFYPDPGLSSILDREQNSCGMKLQSATNKLVSVEIGTVSSLFPYNYDFATAFNERFMGIIKWLKQYHPRNTQSTASASNIGPDLSFKIDKLVMEIEDDPFETKLRNNFMLLEDEYHEQLKRDQTLQDKINELKRTNLMLASSMVEELNRSLAKKNADIYIQRSKQLYNESRHLALFTVLLEDSYLKVVADSSFHKHQDLKNMIKTLNPESPMPDDIKFTTLWCRLISANFKNAEISLRDFPLSMLSFKDLMIKGTLMGAEQLAVARARRSCKVYVGNNIPQATVERSMTPMKWYHNLQLRATNACYYHGPCWEPVLAQVSLAFDNIISASSDPSQSLPWWDKMRFIFHGPLKVNCNQLSVVLHASNDPYNTTELIELSLARSSIDWTTGNVRIKGDLDCLLHTASKYDECRFIHLPNIDVTFKLDWNCCGNQHDHHSVMPCAPDKVPDYSSHHTHDSYRSFRSQSLSLKLNIETQCTSPTSSLNPENIPSALFFGSTIRWLEAQKFIFVGASKLTRRGKLFNNTKPKKLSFGRIFKDVRVTASLNKFQIYYWSSVSKRHGIQIIGGEYTHSSEHNLKLITETADGLKHRSRPDWRIVYMNSELSSVEIWLHNRMFDDMEEFKDSNFQSSQKNRQYFLSFNKVSYNKEAQLKHTDSLNEFATTSAETTSETHSGDTTYTAINDEQTPNHRLIVHDLKGAWTKANRDVVLGIFDAFMNSQQLKRNLSTDALKPICIEGSHVNVHHQPYPSSSSPPYRHQRHPSTTSNVITNSTTSPVSTISKSRAVSMLHKLIADSENNPTVYTEESHGGVANKTHLYGVEACQTDDIVYLNCLIELVNSQVMLCGCETPGYIIVSAAETQIRHRVHLPVWKNRTLLSKTSWTGSLKCMQYYATVDGSTNIVPSLNLANSEGKIQWLDPENIGSENTISDLTDLVGSGHSVGGVVSPVVGKLERSNSDEPSPIQLQRIISRCGCLFYYASHTEGLPEELIDFIPPLPDDDIFIEPWDKEVGVDSFTLTHHDLEISTNSQQYAMIMDMINNLLLYVEPHKKTAFEKLERMRFRFQLSSDEDQREPISKLQDQVRHYVAYLKRLERERYLIYRASIDDHIKPESGQDYRRSLSSLSCEIIQIKEQLLSASEELAMMISCYKEMQLGAHKAQEQQAASQQGSGAFFANVIKRDEICFKNARWRMTDSDGQLGLADIVLRNFLYSKVAKSDDSVEHTIELGHLHVSNLIPNQPYKNVLHPTELQANIPLDRHRALRIYCRELAPVAGISVKEHLEVNVVPFTIEVTLQFFQKMLRFFFPEKDAATADSAKSKRGADSSGEHQLRLRRRKDKSQIIDTSIGNLGKHQIINGSNSINSGVNSGFNNGLVTSKNFDEISTMSTISAASLASSATATSVNSAQKRGDDIEKMRERASKNHTFVYVKVPGIPIRVSYKGKKQKSVTDLKNVSLTLPTFEYHNSTWTWLDLLLALKNDSKHTVIKQALKQKMKIRPSSIWSKSVSHDHQPSIESSSKEKNTATTDDDKARLLLGQYAKRRPSDLSSADTSSLNISSQLDGPSIK